jgi:hypothetical protein
LGDHRLPAGAFLCAAGSDTSRSGDPRDRSRILTEPKVSEEDEHDDHDSDDVEDVGGDALSPCQPRAVVRDRRDVMNQFVVAVFPLGVLGSVVLAGCEKGPSQKVGEKLDKTLDKLSGKGPLEKAGEHLDKAVDELTKK